MPELDLWAWIMIVIAGVCVGFSKTGISTMGILTLIFLTFVFDAKSSIGIALPVLIAGDLIAVVYYRRSVVWKHLFSLIPWVLIGILAGYAVLRAVDSGQLSLMMGVLILTLILLQIGKDKLGPELNKAIPQSLWFVASMGILAGFATMIGNIAGVIMAIYLMSRQLPKQEFVGTGAWFFLAVNLIKIPFYGDLGVITAESLRLNMWMVPAVCLGAYIGIVVLRRIPQRLFQSLILLMGAVGAIRLIFM